MKRLMAFALLGALASSCSGSKQSLKEGAPRVPPEEPWRGERPAAGPPAEVKPPSFARETLKNGLTVVVAEEHALPIVQVSFVVRAGTVTETAKEAGLTQLTFDMLDEGAGDLDALALSDAISSLGTNVAIGSGREAGSLSMQLLKRNLDEGVKLLALMVQKPKFAGDDFERIKARHLSGLIARAGDPRSVASDVFALTMYGGEHAYGWPGSGTEATVSKLKAPRAKKMWSDIAGPKASAIVFSGDITLDEAKAIAEAHFGKWKGGAATPKPPKDPKPHAATTLRLVDFPGTPQTVLVVGRPVVKRGDPDEPALVVFNQVLGGMFSSRLNLNLREAKGWTYGAWSNFEGRAAPGPFQAGAGIKVEHTAAAVAEVFNEFEQLKSGGIRGDDELQAAKSNYVKSLPGRFETITDVAGAASDIFVYDLPLDYYTTMPDRVMAVTADDVKKAAERALVKEQMTVVLVGDKAQVLEGVKALGLGEVTVVDAQGAPVKN